MMALPLQRCLGVSAAASRAAFIGGPPCFLGVRAPLQLQLQQQQQQQMGGPYIPVSLGGPRCWGPSVQQRRGFGAGDLKIVAARMKSVKSIQKITKAMKMVAASKLRSDQRRLENGMPFALPMQRVVSRITIPEPKTDLTMLVLSSDKGLCGGIHSSVSRCTRAAVAEAEASGVRAAIAAVGDKMRSALQRVLADRFSRVYTETARTPCNFAFASVLADRLLQEKPSSLCVVYNKFVSAVSYKTVVQPLLAAGGISSLLPQQLSLFEFEPELKDVWADFYAFYLACTVYGALLDSIAAEQSARMSAMDAASNNAGDMINKLNLKFNRARQAKITTELVEIISGANALN